MVFRNSTGKRFSLIQVAEEISNFINSDKMADYELMIGSDSQFHSGNTNFATAIVIHKKGCGARFFICEHKIKGKMDICSKILEETRASIEIMRSFEESDFIYAVGDVSIHIDASKNGLSNKIIKECVAYVKGYGYDYRVKPHAVVATNVADRFTK